MRTATRGSRRPPDLAGCVVKEVAVAAARPRAGSTPARRAHTTSRGTRPRPRCTAGGRLPMPAVTSRRAACLTVPALCALLVTGCGGKKATSTAASTPSTTTLAPATTAAATTTTAGPMTGKELVWLEAISKLHKKIDTVLVNSPSNLTSATMSKTANDLRGCSRELARLGLPTARLQSVYKLAQSGCAQYDKAVDCFAAAAAIGIPVAGTAEERKFNQAVDCGFKTPEKGSLLLAQAEGKGFEIKEKAG